jgi:putative flippase GtrA
MSVTRLPLVRLLKFGTVGASGVIVNQATLWFAREQLFAGMSPRLRLNAALAVAISLATLNNYLWNRFWTWRDRNRTRSTLGTLAQFAQYCAAAASGTALQVILTNVFASFVHYLLANLCAIVLASGLNFAINSRWTFRGHPAAARVLPRGMFP